MEHTQTVRRARSAAATLPWVGKSPHIFLFAYAAFWLLQAASSRSFIPARDLAATYTLACLTAAIAITLTIARNKPLNAAFITASSIYCITGTVLVWHLAPGYVLGGTLLVSLLPPVIVCAICSPRRYFAPVLVIWLLCSADLFFRTRLSELEAIFAVLIVLVPVSFTILMLRHAHKYRTQQLSLLERLANHDPLTETLNRRGLEAQFTQWQRHGAQPSLQSIIVFDIDHFKQANDVLGHTRGDQILRRIADISRTFLNPGDLLSRSGGEEFVILTSGNGPELAEKLRHKIESMELGGAHVPVTISAGVAPPQNLSDVRTSELWRIIDSADAALYRAKSDGRNRVRISEAGELRSSTRRAPSAARNQHPNPPRRPLDGATRIRGRIMLPAAIFIIFGTYLLLSGLAKGCLEGPWLGVGILALGCFATWLSLGSRSGSTREFCSLLLLDFAVAVYGWHISSPLTWAAVGVLIYSLVATVLYFERRLVIAHSIILTVEVFTLYAIGPVGKTAWWPLYAIIAVVILAVIAYTVREFKYMADDLTARASEATYNDPLTGALNRRGLVAHTGLLTPGTYRLEVIDIDRFKLINDARGHAYGDAALIATVDAIRAELPQLHAGRTLQEIMSDALVARLGGDEFVVIYPEQPDSLLRSLEPQLRARGFTLSFSRGHATFDGSTAELWGAIDRADRELLASRAEVRAGVRAAVRPGVRAVARAVARH